MPLTWGKVFQQPLFPIPHVLAALKRPIDGDRVKPDTPGYVSAMDVKEHVLYCLNSLNRIALAALMYSSPLLFPIKDASLTSVSWLLPILIRYLVLFCGVAVVWDWFLYYSPASRRLQAVKYNPEPPPPAQYRRDLTYTAVSCVMATLIEGAAMILWRRGTISYTPISTSWDTDASWFGIAAHLLTQRSFIVTAILCLTVLHWRLPHFYIVHRAIHPWRVSLPVVGDVGAWFYKHVHKLHHLSRNPTALSGIAMHPFEGFLYFTASLLPLFLGCHPFVFLVCHIDLGLGAILGHDGFHYPGSASQVHWMHHHYFECNYGENILCSFDHLFGTFYDGRKPYTEWKKTAHRGGSVAARGG